MQLKGMSVMCESVLLPVAEDSFPVSIAAELYEKGKYFSVTANPLLRFWEASCTLANLRSGRSDSVAS